MNSRGTCRVAILSPILSNPQGHHGGITPVIRNLAHGFAAHGIEVDLLVRLPAQRAHVPPDLPSTIRVYDLGTHHRFTTTIAVARYLRRERPIALLAAGHRFNLVAASLRRFVSRARIILSVHNTVTREAAKRSSFKRWRRIRSVARHYRYADGIVAVSQGVAADLVQNVGLEKEQIRVIYNPIVTAELNRLATEPLSHPWLTDGSPPVILAVGRLAPQKAFNNLLEAFVCTRAQVRCRLIILGDGPQRSLLENRASELGIADDVDLPGFVANPYAYMRRAALLVSSSDFEGFGNVLVESLAVGTPVVSTDCPSGPREILQDGKFGRLVPIGMPKALSDAILETLANPPPPDRLREAVQRFGADAVVSQYIEYLGLTESCPELELA